MNYKDPNSIVQMFGPSISDPSKVVNRDVPQRDVEAYKAAGYQVGSIPEPVVEVIEEPVEAPAPKKRKR